MGYMFGDKERDIKDDLPAGPIEEPEEDDEFDENEDDSEPEEDETDD